MPAPFDLSRALAEQLARPQGLPGRLLAGAMDLANRRPTRLAVGMLAAKPGERVLDAGCGSGAAMVEVLRLARCLLSGIDASTAMLAIARRRLGDAVELRQARIEAMPFGDACFDAALALNVLYFCDPQHAMIASLHRVLRPGGRLVVYVTHRRTMERWSFARRGLHRLFDEESLIRALTAGGFDPLRIRVHSKPIAPSVTGLLAVARR